MAISERSGQEPNVPFFLPSIGTEEEQAVLRVMRSGWLTTGQEAPAFEKEFADFVGCKHALAVNSATSGLMLSMSACGIRAGTKILTTPYTFVSTATTAFHLGGGAVYADTEEDGYNIDPAQIEQKLKKDRSIRAIVPVHMGGLPCNMTEIKRIADFYGVKVIEDAAHAFPSKTAQGYAGTLGDAGVFSFYATKTITTGEGGMICTNNDTIAEAVRIMRMHGIDRTVWDRYTSKNASWKYDVVKAGFKCNLPDILAAIGREQLKKAQILGEKRKKIALRYTEAFKNFDFLECPPDGEGNAWHLYLLRICREKLSINRDEFGSLLQQRGINISVHFIPHFHFTFFKKHCGLNVRSFPHAQKLYETTLSLPLWPDMDDAMIEQVIQTVTDIGKNNYEN
ncbi:DegT/DnrJ/EryC1/StrS family aminotransferase [Treponema sp. HNW]|uniref:DegT/DnrJ/EryC1/StrS family aminotransferase n=1 Tax=Treponema sp. HNW TaxID=3116654 RepID=UPI003D12EF78